MNNQVLIIGLDPAKISLPEVSSDNSFSKGNICIVQLKTAQQTSLLLRKLEGFPDIQAYSLKEFYSIMSAKEREYTPLKRLEPREFVDFQFSEREQFVVINNGVLSLLEQKNKEFEEIGTFEKAIRCLSSDDGVFVCFVGGRMIEFRTGRYLEMFSRIELGDEVVNMSFSPDNRFAVVSTKKETSVWDIFKNECLTKQQGVTGDTVLDEDHVYFLGLGKVFSLLQGKEVEPDPKLSFLKCIRHHNGQKVEFSDDRVQKIRYEVGEYKLSKTHANIEDIKFYFSGKRCFVLMTKNIQKKKVQFVESYGTDGITLTQLEGCVEQIEVSDKMFVVVDTKQTLSFYIRNRFGFGMAKQIRKEDDLLIALYDDICCVHDADTGNIEFYDNGELRSAYSHPSCTGISWSYSGLYAASVSAGDCSSGLVQMFNRNGKLLWKKVFNRLTLFMWRPFSHLSSEDKAKAVEEFSESIENDTSEEECTEDTSELLSRWKSYLISKKQRVLSLK
ncbi:uncharacterized protein Eint_060370 [Encephalitozoon intestinalis ATCC 50506]|uniref:Uncharacterized protein n=1 Tax=Encephalitozoon intestinalis (strain ATCC 50506) TaxID=876142 RepID=E0S7G6_ENCIT|nr:uncharacterized protein Eint_060370 [Encephalitozoon intestinalis ATCC 50506]ADM11645.1 hypothetical protein Eint_060370 [Encephalitozoon intestinalis ATCC 50506]UTX45379.1 WD40 domain-containing protein [Encephalitozoon intestinalis]